MTSTAAETGGSAGTDDLLILPLQSGTQWDALAHIVFDQHIYNGYDATDVGSKGAIRNDIAKARDRSWAAASCSTSRAPRASRGSSPVRQIHAADLEACAGAQGVEIGRGDIVLIRTGQMAQCRAEGSWGAYAGGSAPGLALDSVAWIADHELAALAADTWGAGGPAERDRRTSSSPSTSS